jgi:hypothetical protein
MLFLRQSAGGSRLGAAFVLALSVFVLPTAVLPSLYHEVASHLLSPPDCAICLSGVSAAASPELPVVGMPPAPIGLVFAASAVELDLLPARPDGGRSPPAGSQPPDR